MTAPEVPTSQITLRLPIDLGGASSTNWLRRADDALPDGMPGKGRPAPVPRNRTILPDGWVETNVPSFVQLPDVVAHFERLGHVVTFTLDEAE